MKVKFFLTSSWRSPVEEFLREQSEDLKGEFLDQDLPRKEIDVALKRIREV